MKTLSGGRKTISQHRTRTTEFLDWAYFPMNAQIQADGTQLPSGLAMLADIALRERWHFGESVDPRNPHPILQNYLKYTFFRLAKEGKVVETGSWATFNTGLVDRLYDPIFALFERNKNSVLANGRRAQPWRFVEFCVPGKRQAGKKLTEEFDPLPAPPDYFKDEADMLFNPAKDIHVDYEHVILDGARRGRFPIQFLREHLPDRFLWEDVASMSPDERNEFLEKLSLAIEHDDRCMRTIKRRLEDAKLLAEKRIRWNFKTAIPQYYPRHDLMSFLLPLALINDEIVDLALVVTRNKSGSYAGRTIFPLDWAYQNARLVCRPDSDWLAPQLMSVRSSSIAQEIEDED